MATLILSQYIQAIFFFLLIILLICCLIYYIAGLDYRWCTNQHLFHITLTPKRFFGNTGSAFGKFGLPRLLHVFHKMGHRHSMMGFYYLRRRAVLLRDPKLINQVMTSKRNSFGPFAEVNAFWDPLMKDSPIFTGDWTSWTHATFTETRVKRMMGNVQELVTKTCRQWINESTPNRMKHLKVDMYIVMLKLAATISVRYGAGVLPNNNDTYRNLYLVALMFHDGLKQYNVMGSAYISKWLSHFWIALDRRSRKLVDKDVEQNFTEAISKLLNDPTTLKSDSFLSWIHKNVSKTEAQRQVYHYFLETYLLLTGIAAYALVYLGENLDVQNQVRREIQSVLKNRTEITLDDLERMTYLDAVIEETQRLSPIMRFIDRKCIQEVELRGCDDQKCVLKPGDLVFASMQAINKDLLLWTRAADFVPKRFSKGKSLLTPFPGLKESPAAPFNRMLVKLVLVTAVRQYEIGDGTKMKVTLDEDKFLMRISDSSFWSTRIRPARKHYSRN